jgi:pilin isopeptide linkage protein
VAVGNNYKIFIPDLTLTGELTIPKDATVWLLGGGTLDAGSQDFRVLTNNGTLYITKLSLVNGSVYDTMAGGILNNGTLYLGEGAVIDGCKADAPAENSDAAVGGGVYNKSSGLLEIEGGTITNCTAHIGGGVANFGVCRMVSGSISGNDSHFSGGGVFNYGDFNMTGGDISGNDTKMYGGGVINDKNFTLDGGTISGNKASDSGGGIYNFEGATLNLVAGNITKNRAGAGGGGGIYIPSADLIKTQVGAGIVFSGNKASSGFYMTDPDDIADYGAIVHTETVSRPFTEYVWNNYDIFYDKGDKLTPVGGASVTLLMAKNAIGAPLVGNEFGFELFDENDQPVATTRNDENGLITFEDVWLDLGDHHYYVAETDSPAGWVADDNKYPVDITVDEYGAVDVTYPDGFTPVFENTFESETCGLIKFPEMTFDAPGDYEFDLKELTPSGSWTTDDKTYRVIVHVVQDDSGNLVATADYQGDFPQFVNYYEYGAAKIVLSACKIAVGKEVTGGEFEFGIFNVDEDGITSDEAFRKVTNGPAAATDPAPENVSLTGKKPCSSCAAAAQRRLSEMKGREKHYWVSGK